MRLALGIFGVKIRFEKESARTLEPVITITRHDGAFMFAASSRDTTVKTEIKMPLGAPIPFGREVKINADGYVDVVKSDKNIPYACIGAFEVPLCDGSTMTVTDYSSAGKTWTEESKMAVWMLTK